MKRSISEVEALKESWCQDPCWDIEETEGFKAHRAELRAFRERMEKKWHADYLDRVQRKAEDLGLVKLVDYIFSLEMKLDKLEERIAWLESEGMR